MRSFPASPHPLSPANSPSPQRRWQVFLVCVLLTVSTWAVFGQTARYGFVNYDDSVYVYDNPDVKNGLSLGNFEKAFTQIHASNWHPVTTLSHQLDCQLYQLSAGGHHLTNVMLHIATAILFFLVLLEMTGALWAGAFAAMVFAIHPLRVESVAWISERKDVLSGLFLMLSLAAYIRYVRRPWSLLRYLAVAGLYALGLMSKPTLVTFPFLLLVLDYWPLRRFTQTDENTVGSGYWRSLWKLTLEKIPLLVLSAASCLATILAQQKAIEPLKETPLSGRIANALVSYVVYIGQMFYPVKLVAFYPRVQNGPPVWEVCLSLLLLLTVTAIAVHFAKQKPWLITGWLWYIGMLVPMIGIMQVGGQAHADRYTYLPQMGLYILIAWTVVDLCGSLNRSFRLAVGGLAAGAVTALMLVAQNQVHYWRDSEALWKHTIAYTRGNAIAIHNLCMSLAENGKLDEAIAYYRTALEIQPDYRDAQYNMALVLEKKGASDEALIHYRKATELQIPNSEAQNNLGAILYKKGLLDEAVLHFQKAVELDPENVEAQNNLGAALVEKGRIDRAIPHYQRALAIQPDFAEAQNNLGNAYFNSGDVERAIACFRKAVGLKPGNAEAQNNLGVALMRQGSMDEATVHFQKALEIDPRFTVARNNMVDVLLKRGQIDRAIIHLRKGLEVHPDDAAAGAILGKLLLQMGRTSEAVVQYEKLLETTPDNVAALNNLAWMLATSSDASLRNGRRAVELAERADKLTAGKDPGILDTLAASYAEEGRFEEAVKTVDYALRLTSVTSPGLKASMEARLKLYTAHIPYREPLK